MLTSSSHSQYLHPDYLQPLPTTLDAKKSPLALLAQTCSSIGKDTTPSKSLIPPLEKSAKDGKSSRSSPNHTKSEDSSSASGDSKSRSKSPTSDGSSKGRDMEKDGVRSPGSDSSKSSFRAPPLKDIPPLVPIAHSPGSRKGTNTPENTGSAGTASSSNKERERDREKDNGSAGSDRGHAGSTGRSSAGLSSTSRISLSCGNMLLEVNHQESVNATSKLSSPHSTSSSIPTSSSSGSSMAMSSASMSMPLSVTSSLASSMLKPLDGLHTPHPGMLGPGFSAAAYAGCLPLGLGHPLDAASMHAHSAYSAHSAMSAAAAAKHASASAHAGLSPYTYARVKTTSGATTLVPICRDPYCTNCQITMQHTALTPSGSTCAAGCTQCSHEKLSGATPLPPSSVASALSAGGLGPSVLSGLGASAAASLYPHAFGVLPGHHGMAYVCNWVAGSDYCGKRFGTSEELLQHLRTHTASSDTAASLAAMQAAAYPGLSMPSPLAAACHSHYPPGSLSPNSIRQAYGRMSPNTLLAASRYHPYSKSPLSGLHSAAPASLQGLPGAPSLGAYYSPYALYGQRLGAVP